jgi:hypothetical protein
MVGTYARRLPSRVVARRVRLVQLEAVQRIVANVEEGDAEWSEACRGR